MGHQQRYKEGRGHITDSEFCWRELPGDKAAVFQPTRHTRSTGTIGSEVDRWMRA
jgi:hypothetical protein